MKDKTFYYTENCSCTIHLIIGQDVQRISTEAVCKEEEGDPVVEETSFGWLVHGGDDYSDDQCMFARENSDCERLFSLNVLGVEDRGNTGREILNNFTEIIVRKETGMYEVSFPWIPGSKPTDTNEQQSRKHLMNV